MPLPRPSSPATISSSNTVAVNADQVWLVDALTGSTIPDLKGGVALTIGNATYTTDGSIGKSLVGSGSGVQAYERFASAGTGLGAYPIAGGVLINGVALTGLSGGTQGVMYYVDDFNLSGQIELRLNLDESAGIFYILWRFVTGDSYGQINGATYVPGTPFAIGYRIDSNSTFALVINGTVYSTGTSEGFSGWDSTARLGVISILGRVNSDQSSTFDESSRINMALSWRAHGSNAANLTNSVLQSWTNDPWTILTSSGGATTVTATGPSSVAVNHATTNFSIGVDTTPITGTVVVTPASNKAGTFSPSTVSLTSGSPSATCTFTPTVSGAHTISFTNNGGLTNPSNIALSVKPEVTCTLVASPTDSTPQASLSSLHWQWTDITDANSATPPSDHGNAATSDGSGIVTIQLPNSTLTNGGTGLLELWSSAGTSVGSAFLTVT